MQPAKEDAEGCSRVPLARATSTGVGTKPATDFLCRRSGFKRPRPGPARSRPNVTGTAVQERSESRQAGRSPDNRWQRYALPQTLPSLPDESQTNPRRAPAPHSCACCTPTQAMNRLLPTGGNIKKDGMISDDERPRRQRQGTRKNSETINGR